MDVSFPIPEEEEMDDESQSDGGGPPKVTTTNERLFAIAQNQRKVKKQSRMSRTRNSLMNFINPIKANISVLPIPEEKPSRCKKTHLKVILTCV